MVDLTDKYLSQKWYDEEGCLMNPNFAFLVNEIDKYNTFVLCGGTRCFSPDQEVVTENGIKRISEIQRGEKVKTYNEQTGIIEWKPVKETLRFNNNKPTVKIKLKNGTKIICSADHEFYFNGRWEKIIDILTQNL